MADKEPKRPDSGTEMRWNPPAGTQPMPVSNLDADIQKTPVGDMAHARTVRADDSVDRLSGEAEVVDSDGPLAEGSIVGERYVVERHVHSGSFGAVYKARDASIGNHFVALKVLHEAADSPRARDSALRELQLIASVTHPSVVQFKDYGWTGGRLWFAMPWYEGATLEEQLAGGTDGEPLALSRVEAHPIFERLAHGLAAMHEVGIYHHDIKPGNILLAKVSGFDGGLPVLLDLGIAAKRGEGPSGFTTVYVSPETASAALGQAEGEIGAPADVYSLALTLRNLLEPETAPSVEGGSLGFLASRAREPVPPPRGRDLRYLAPHFNRWLSIDPVQRPTAEEFAGELSILFMPEQRRRARQRLLRRLVPFVLLVGALLTLLVFQLMRQEEQLTVQKERIVEQHQKLSQTSVEAERLRKHTKQQQEKLAEEAERTKQTELEALEAKRVARRLDSKLSKTEKAREELDEQLEQLRGSLTELSSEHEALNKALDLIQQERDQLEDERNKLRGDRNRLQKERDQLEADRNSLQADRDKLLAEYEDLKSQNRDLQKVSDALLKRIESIRRERDRIDKERQALKQERDRLRKQKERLNAEPEE